MAEEVRNADVTVPWSMLVTTVLNGAFGFGIVIAVLYVTVDVGSVLQSPTGVLGYPYMQIFYNATGSKGGATAMFGILIVMSVFGTTAALATASRLIWAFARDRGLPFWRQVSKGSGLLRPTNSLIGVVSRRTQVQAGSSIPVYAVLIASLTACVIGLINIGSSAAFNDVISLSVTNLYASYVLTESFLLYRRCTGGIRTRNSIDDTTEPGILIWGPFHLPGIFGIGVNVIAVCFGIIIFVFSFFPIATPVTPQSMNFSVVMSAFVLIAAVVYYIVWARKEFKGPIVEVAPYSMEQTMMGSDNK